MILVLGGARSGKSTFAEKKATEIKNELNTNVMYVATSIGFDAQMRDRIEKHRDNRDNSWITLEKYKDFNIKDEKKGCEVVLLDCLTLMISNIILEAKYDFDSITTSEVDILEKEVEFQIKKYLDIFKDKQLIIVSNEVGLGLVPAYKLGAIFRDIAGRMNQMIAMMSDEVYLLTAGIEMRIK
ncbi:MAG: bifunctional adenosylcobinamide kinase/adenosylcobinamide-phosphate guanylyltransferase [Sarcina sp.]